MKQISTINASTGDFVETIDIDPPVSNKAMIEQANALSADTGNYALIGEGGTVGTEGVGTLVVDINIVSVGGCSLYKNW